jgi:hypothetical protein
MHIFKEMCFTFCFAFCWLLQMYTLYIACCCWLQCVIDGLARVLCMREELVPDHPQDVTTPKKTWSTFVTAYRSFSDPETLCAKVHLLDAENNLNLDPNKPDLADISLEDFLADVAETSAVGSSYSSRSWANAEWLGEGSVSSDSDEDARVAELLLGEVGDIREMMTDWEESRDMLTATSRNVKEWGMISLVLDRFFFVMYIAINLCGLLAIFVRVFMPD